MSQADKKIMKIMALALEISPFGSGEQEGKPHVFVNYSPHCDALDVRVFADGWAEGKKADYDEFLYDYNGDFCKKADKVIAYLENFIAKGVWDNDGTV